MKFNSEIPEIDLSKITLTPEENNLVQKILTSGKVRRTRPPLPKKVAIGGHYQYKNEEDRNCGRACYLWREVVFVISPISAHHCMPCSDIFYLDAKFGEALEKEKKMLNELADRIVNIVPKDKWYGIQRWGRALGV